MRRPGRIVIPLSLWLLTALAAQAAKPNPRPPAPLLRCTGGMESGLPLPSSYPKREGPGALQSRIGDFLRNATYRTLGWCEDKGVRDTGPFIDGKYYGTHPAVRIWYSPAAARWVLGGRKGDIPDGAMIVKEQFAPTPAAQYDGWSEAQLDAYFAGHQDWTFMIRDRQGSADGWYWGEIFDKEELDSYEPPFAVFNTGFGLYCVRCHASADSLLTFSATSNMKGMPGHPLTYRDDLSWFVNGVLTPPKLLPPAIAAPPVAALAPTPPAAAERELEPLADASLLALLARPAPQESDAHPHVSRSSMPKLGVAHVAPNRDWTTFFASSKTVAAPNPLPGENYDHVVSPPVDPRHFVTSDQCVGCHAGNRYGNVMLQTDPRLDSNPLVNISPYGEWRWSPMGLAGRDPIFYAQLDSERAYLGKHRPDQLAPITNLCFSCHGAMGQRQMALEGKGNFTPDIVKVTDRDDPRFLYGALARDGISCAVCHHIAKSDAPLMTFIEKEATGRFNLTPATQLEGPFEQPATVPMDHALGVEPVHDSYTKSARICGTCHTIPLPVVDATDDPHEAKTVADCQAEKTSFEQATYLEWINSSYQNELLPALNPNIRTCQDCHMKGALGDVAVKTQIAAVQDYRYPAAEHLAPEKELQIPIRSSGYTRHQFQGLNVFLLAMFDQFNETLGVRKCDYMSSGCSGQTPASGIPFAMRNFADQAARETATLSVGKPLFRTEATSTTVTADVTVTNLTGHRFPSGVSFRRAFIDFIVTDTHGTVLFESGGTNSIGAIVDEKRNVLPSEFNGSTGPGGQAYQPHYWTGNPITNSGQVQIYEELLKDADGNFTTSFIRQDCHFKDNRILPDGWQKWGPDVKAFNGKPLEETWPDLTGDDPYYGEASGGLGQSVVRYQVPLPAGTAIDEVRVSAQLYYQAIPPYYLLQRFEQAPEGSGTQRLLYMVQALDTTKTAFPGWKLLVAQASTQ